MSGDLPSLTEARILGIMAACLQQRAEHPVGSALWGEAVRGYAACKQELDRRLVEHIVKATAERDAGTPGGSI